MKHPKCNTNLPLTLYLITGCWQWLWFRVADNYSHSFEYVCSPKTDRTFKALYMLKCLSKSKSNLIFFPVIIFKAFQSESHSDPWKWKPWDSSCCLVENCSWTKGRESYAPLGAISKPYLLSPGWPQVHLRVSDGEAIPQVYYFNWQKAVADVHRGKSSILPLLSLPFISSSGFTSKIPSNEQSVSLGTVKCVIPTRRCSTTNVAGGTRARTMVPTWSEAKNNVSVLLLEGCHDTQTYTLPFSVGIQPKQAREDSQQKGGERSVSAANRQLEPPMSLSRGCSWTIAFLWSSCITWSLFYLFS